MSLIFEMAMVILFGLSWPINIVKAYKAKTAKGTSFIFLTCIFVGYLCGILSKLIAHKITYVFIFYIINFLMVGLHIALYFRNWRLDKHSVQ
ncbi:MAG: PQ-loop domain-containing transporter [Bacilli bacterium]|jgi:hypothetical protein|nr:PQ-loop domain-containing transporter [Bacilli bacterium]HHU24474.1 hypothetical protein [Acholeplasmataceae bacterium]